MGILFLRNDRQARVLTTDAVCTTFVLMKNITLSADEKLIELAREEARTRKTTLNALFRDWLEEIARREEKRKMAENVIQRMSQFDSGRPFTREEMNER